MPMFGWNWSGFNDSDALKGVATYSFESESGTEMLFFRR